VNGMVRIKMYFFKLYHAILDKVFYAPSIQKALHIVAPLFNLQPLFTIDIPPKISGA
jgi:hypothetical protein